MEGFAEYLNMEGLGDNYFNADKGPVTKEELDNWIYNGSQPNHVDALDDVIGVRFYPEIDVCQCP